MMQLNDIQNWIVSKDIFLVQLGFIAIFVILFIILRIATKPFVTTQIENRKKIIQYIEEEKKLFGITYQENNFTQSLRDIFKKVGGVMGNEKAGEKAAEHFSKKPFLQGFSISNQLNDEEMKSFEERSRNIVRKNNGKPYKLIGWFLFPFVFFLLFIAVMQGVDFWEDHIIYPILTSIAMGSLIWNRRIRYIAAILSIVFFFIYKRLSPEANIFIFMSLVIRIIQKQIKKKKKLRT